MTDAPTLNRYRGWSYMDLLMERDRLIRFEIQDLCASEMRAALKRLPPMVEYAGHLAEVDRVQAEDIRELIHQLRCDIEEIEGALPEQVAVEAEARAEAEADTSPL